MKLLIIEREQSALKQNFKHMGYQVDYTNNEILGLSLYQEKNYDLIVMNLQSQFAVPFKILKAIRKCDTLQKVILYSAQGDIQERIQTLELVECDYILNSNDFEDLVSYAAFILNKEPKCMAFGNLIWNPSSGSFEIEGSLLDFAPLEYTVFEYLLNHAGDVISAGALINHAMSKNINLLIDSLKDLIGSIRFKLHQHKGTCVIDTIRGQGYIVMNGGTVL